MILTRFANSASANKQPKPWRAAAFLAYPLILLLSTAAPAVSADTADATAPENSTNTIRVLSYDNTELVYRDVDTASVPKLFPITQVPAHVSMGFGVNENPILGGTFIHEGLDLSTFRTGDPVVATMDSEVLAIGFSMDEGNYIILRQGAVLVCYFHLKSFTVQKGQQLRAGNLIGYIGITGLSATPHLHYQIHICADAGATPVIRETTSSSGGQTLLLPDGYSIDPLPLLRLGGWTGADPA